LAASTASSPWPLSSAASAMRQRSSEGRC
jgi:hypothetical protein